MNQETFNKIVAFVVEHSSDVNERKSLLNRALYGCKVLTKIDYAGNARDYTTHLVQTLVSYGSCSQGKQSIVTLLETIASELVGKEKEAAISELIGEILSTSNTQQNMVLESEMSARTFQTTTLPSHTNKSENAKLEQNPQEEALLRIREAKDEGLEKLDLTGLGLEELPTEIWKLSQIKTLYLNQNSLRSVSPNIDRLSELEQLSLTANKLSSLPPEIGSLNNLKLIFLNRNQLKTLPSEFWDLVNLIGLYLAENQLAQLSPEIIKLKNLERLYLNHNQLLSLPIEIGGLPKLGRKFTVREGNSLSEIPEIVVNGGNRRIRQWLKEQFDKQNDGDELDEEEMLYRRVLSNSNDTAIVAIEEIRYRGLWNELLQRLLNKNSRISLRKVSWQRAKLSGVNLQKADLYKANLKGAELINTDLQEAYCEFAIFSESELRKGKLQKTNLVDADFSKADLQRANLQDARLFRTNFQGANLCDASLRDAQFVDSTRFDGDTILPDARFQGYDEEGNEVYDKYWTPNTDMTLYTDSERPDFWKPEWVKKQHGQDSAE